MHSVKNTCVIQCHPFLSSHVTLWLWHNLLCTFFSQCFELFLLSFACFSLLIIWPGFYPLVFFWAMCVKDFFFLSYPWKDQETETYMFESMAVRLNSLFRNHFWTSVTLQRWNSGVKHYSPSPHVKYLLQISSFNLILFCASPFGILSHLLCTSPTLRAFCIFAYKMFTFTCP